MMSTRGKGVRAQVDACGRGRGSAPHGYPHKKLEPTDINLSSFHVNKVVFFLDQNFVFG